MRIGLAGVGRIGAFHAATLAGLDAVDQVVVADANPALAASVARSRRKASTCGTDSAILGTSDTSAKLP